MSNSSFTDLRVWQESIELATEVYGHRSTFRTMSSIH